MARVRPGDRVIVKGEKGEGEGRVVGIDERSGALRVHYDRVVARDQDQDVLVENMDGYALPENCVRRK